MDTESSNTSLEDQNDDIVSPTRDALVDGFISILKPCLDQLDEKVRATRLSQSQLHQQLEVLSEELSDVHEKAQCPLELDSYIKKLQNAKRRVVVVNNILQNTQERLTKLHTVAVKETNRRKTLIESTPNIGSSS